VRIGCRSVQKLVEEVKKYKDWKFDSIYLTDESPVEKENSIWGEKSKIRCLWTQLNFIEGLIEFMKGLIARKINF
jgi:hypothetical protein